MRNPVAVSLLACSCALTAHVGARACDTWVALPDVTASGATILAKNSDRPTFESSTGCLNRFHTTPAEQGGVVVEPT